MACAGPEISTLQGGEKRGRRLHFELQEIRRIPTSLLERLRVDVAELEPVGGAYDAGTAWVPGETELGPEGVAVTVKIDRSQVIYLIWRGYGHIAQTVG